MNSVPDSLSFDELLSALGHAERRRLLVALAVESGDASVDIDAPSSEEGPPDRRLVTLHHTHLPKLDELDLVDWDRDAGQLTRGPRFGDAEPLLRLLLEHPDELPHGAVVPDPLHSEPSLND